MSSGGGWRRGESLHAWICINVFNEGEDDDDKEEEEVKRE